MEECLDALATSSLGTFWGKKARVLRMHFPFSIQTSCFLTEAALFREVM